MAEPVHYERMPKKGDRYVITSCRKKRLPNDEPYYKTTRDTNKVTCEDCKDGPRYIGDRRRFILGQV